jgi:hypothetical protein
MAWEMGVYYRRSVWEHGKVRSEYFGAGPAALGVAILDREDRAARRRARAAARRAEAAERRLFAEERRLLEGGRRLVECGLEGLGYVRHHRHPWRRRRTMTSDLAIGEAGPPPAAADIKALAERVRAKEPHAYQEFRELTIRHPVAVVAAMRLDLARLSREILANRTVGGKEKDDAPNELALLAQMKLIYEGLAGDRPGPALQLCAWDAAFCWVVRQALCTLQAHKGVDQATPLQLRRGAAAQREYLRAVKTCHRLAAIEGGD